MTAVAESALWKSFAFGSKAPRRLLFTVITTCEAGFSEMKWRWQGLAGNVRAWTLYAGLAPRDSDHCVPPRVDPAIREITR